MPASMIESLGSIFRPKRDKPALDRLKISRDELPFDVLGLIDALILRRSSWINKDGHYYITFDDELVKCFVDAKDTRHPYVDAFLEIKGSTPDGDKIKWSHALTESACWS